SSVVSSTRSEAGLNLLSEDKRRKTTPCFTVFVFPHSSGSWTTLRGEDSTLFAVSPLMYASCGTGSLYTTWRLGLFSFRKQASRDLPSLSSIIPHCSDRVVAGQSVKKSICTPCSLETSTNSTGSSGVRLRSNSLKSELTFNELTGEPLTAMRNSCGLCSCVSRKRRANFLVRSLEPPPDAPPPLASPGGSFGSGG